MVDIEELARKYFPAFRFSKGPGGSNEVFYPVEVESWLTHKARPVQEDRYRRGTALYRWRAQGPLPEDTPEQWKAQEPVIGAGEITLDKISRAEFSRRPDATDADSPGTGDWYLDFGGWDDPNKRSYGRMGYSWKVYRDLYTGIGLPVDSLPPEPDGHPDDLANADPEVFKGERRGLHAYVEVERVDKSIDALLLRELPDVLKILKQKVQGGTDLQNIWSLTYYLFYPVYAPPGGTLMEGQWEAVSVFLHKEGDEFSLQHVSYTQGYENSGIQRVVNPWLVAACRAAGDIEEVVEYNSGDGLYITVGQFDSHAEGDIPEIVAEHPVVYVAWGSHANYFSPRDVSDATTQNDLNVIDLNLSELLLPFLALVTIAEGLGCLIEEGITDSTCWDAVRDGLSVLPWAVFLAISITTSLEDPCVADCQSFDQTPRNDIHQGDGAAADLHPGTSDEPPQASEGRIPFVIHPFSPNSDITDQLKFQPPRWWKYAGRWGVCVADYATATEQGSASWSNGVWRRRPASGYTPTHCNIEALLDYLHNEIDDETDTAYTYR